jgi:chromosome segregation ATPase
MKKFSEIDKCKSDIGKCKSDIASLEESLKQTTKKIPDMQRDIANLKTSRVLVSAFQSKIHEIETQLHTLDDIVKHLGENDKERLNQTKTWVPLLVEHDKNIKNLKSQFDLIDDIVKHLGENDKERIKDTQTWVPLLVGHSKDISDLKSKITQITETNAIVPDITEYINTQNSSINNLNNKILEINGIVTMLGENDKERLKETKTTTSFLVAHDNDISQLKNKLKSQNFSLNSKGMFSHELKKTLFFEPGLILPHKIYVYSLYITTSIKAQAKHNRKFDFIIIKNGSPESIHSFEKDALQELIMEEFNPPIEIPSKTKMLVACNKRLDGMALLTISY